MKGRESFRAMGEYMVWMPMWRDVVAQLELRAAAGRGAECCLEGVAPASQFVRERTRWRQKPLQQHCRGGS